MTADVRGTALSGRESAGRFAQRVRAERRRRNRRLLLAAALICAMVAGVVLVGRSSLLRVSSVVVIGAERQQRAEVLATAAVRIGSPMWTLDTQAVRRRVAGLPRVRTARVSRIWPRTVRITISERQPVAAVSIRGGDIVVVDSTAAEIERTRVPPAAMLAITLTGADLPDSAQSRRLPVAAALAVAAALPATVRGRVASLRVASAQDVELVLTGGSVVRWGSAERSERKAAVLTALLVSPRAVYDVTAPEFPAVR